VFWNHQPVKLLGITYLAGKIKWKLSFHPGTLKKWMFGEITMFYIKIWNHPIETTIKNGCLGYQDGLKWLSKGFRFNFGVCVVATVPNLLNGHQRQPPCRQPEWLYTMIQRRQRKKGDENLWKKNRWFIHEEWMMMSLMSDEWMMKQWWTNVEWMISEWWMNDVWMMNECWMDDEWMMNEWWVNGS